MNAEEAIQVSELLGCNKVIPIHYEGWWHFKEPVGEMKKTLNQSSMADKIIWLERGKSKTIEI
jgi:L-ascorbate metabolism protein UlaG (beta-lactamase superfamily)